MGLEFLLYGHRDLNYMVAHHSAIARALAKQLALPEAVQNVVGAAYERWDGRGWPGEVGGKDMPVAARIAQAAEFVEVAHRVGGISAVKKLARQRRGGQFDPEISDLLLADGEALLSGIESVAAWDAVIGAEQGLALVVTGHQLDAALTALANFIDLKSPYFLGGQSRDLRHRHRERLDGSGYPRGMAGARLPREARFLGAADAYQAMREPRPHRASLNADQAATELRAEVKAGRHDAEAVDAVLAAAGHRVTLRREGPAGLTVREVEVLRLLARGLSNKEMAERLFISPKTVSNHVEHIYVKIDTTSRADASLFAMQNGLLPEEEFPVRIPAAAV